MRTRHVAFVVTVLAVALLTACADGTGEPESTPSPPEGNVTETPPPATPITPPPTKPVPTVTEGEVTISGQVVEGVEAGCLVLRVGTTEYLLILADGGDVRAGSTVTVRGRAEPDMITTCQQGTPFVVTEVTPS